MGRWSYSNRTEADGLKKVEIWWLKRHGYLNGCKFGGMEWKSGWDDSKSSVGFTVSTYDSGGYIQFRYTQTDQDEQKTEFDYKIPLTTTPCKYGGKRYWFLCPLVKSDNYCGRRIGVLYKAGNYFGCRHCYDLTYSSQKESRGGNLRYLFRLMDVETKIDKIREKMKRSFYAGKPTRKMRRIMRLNQGAAPYVDILLEKEKRDIL